MAVLVLVANIILFALKIISWILFWAVIIAVAVFAYKIVPEIGHYTPQKIYRNKKNQR